MLGRRANISRGVEHDHDFVPPRGNPSVTTVGLHPTVVCTVLRIYSCRLRHKDNAAAAVRSFDAQGKGRSRANRSDREIPRSEGKTRGSLPPSVSLRRGVQIRFHHHPAQIKPECALGGSCMLHFLVSLLPRCRPLAWRRWRTLANGCEGSVKRGQSVDGRPAVGDTRPRGRGACSYTHYCSDGSRVYGSNMQ